MARPRSTASDVMIRLPEGTRKHAELFAEEEGIPLSTWCADIVKQYVRGHMALFANQQAAQALETMMDAVEREFKQGGVEGGVVVAPPPGSRNAPMPQKKPVQRGGKKP